MFVDPSQYEEIPENRHSIQAGCVLIPTQIPIVAGGGTSLEFVRQQGGDDHTFVFMFGVRPVFNLGGQRISILEGVFLAKDGPGFRPTWDFDQLLRETDLGGWQVVPTSNVLESWTQEIEARMSR